MNRPNPHLDELRSLLDALCEQSIAPEQVRRLEELVLSHPEAEAYYVQYMNLYANLVGRFGGLQSRTEQTLRDRVGIEQSVTGRERPAGVKPQPRSPRHRRLPWGTIGLTGMAAGLLLVLALWQRSEDPVRPVEPLAEMTDNTVAVLLQAPGAKWEESGLPTRPGAPLVPGVLRLKSGFAHIEFYSGATVILEGPAEFQLISRNEGYCVRGKLRATVPPQAEGFTIGSPELDLVDRGTEFGLDVGAGGKTEVHVFQGKVELYNPGPHRKDVLQEVTTGQGVRLQAPGTVEAIQLNPEAFQTAQNLAERLEAETRRRQQDWLKASEKFRQDKDLEIYYTFQGDQSWSRTLHDRATMHPQPREGAIVGCSWVTGRWPGKQGLEFKRVSDRVRFHVPGQFDALTLAAWVRVDALPNRFNSLMMTDSWDEFEAHWHIGDGGKVELGVQGPGRKNGVHYVTGQVFTPERLGQWTHLAVVYDREHETVIHYVDGRKVKQEALKLDAALRIGDAELGNWNITTRPHSYPVRYFSGCMDEFMMFSRALSAKDIKELYTQGRPPL